MLGVPEPVFPDHLVLVVRDHLIHSPEQEFGIEGIFPVGEREPLGDRPPSVHREDQIDGKGGFAVQRDRLPTRKISVEIEVLCINELPVAGGEEEAEIPSLVEIHQLDRDLVPGEVVVQFPFPDHAAMRRDLGGVQIRLDDEDLFLARGSLCKELAQCSGGSVRTRLLRNCCRCCGHGVPLHRLDRMRSCAVRMRGPGRRSRGGLDPHPDDEDQADKNKSQYRLFVHALLLHNVVRPDRSLRDATDGTVQCA